MPSSSSSISESSAIGGGIGSFPESWEIGGGIGLVLESADKVPFGKAITAGVSPEWGALSNSIFRHLRRSFFITSASAFLFLDKRSDTPQSMAFSIAGQ